MTVKDKRGHVLRLTAIAKSATIAPPKFSFACTTGTTSSSILYLLTSII